MGRILLLILERGAMEKSMNPNKFSSAGLTERRITGGLTIVILHRHCGGPPNM
jgi:hypothetical protein